MVETRVNYIVKVPCLNNKLFYTSSKKKIKQWDAIPIFVSVGLSNNFFKVIRYKSPILPNPYIRTKGKESECEFITNLPYRTDQEERWLLNNRTIQIGNNVS